MTYFDTDVLVHFVIQQDESKHIKAQELIFEAVKNSRFCISFLTIQELLFVLEKLGVERNAIARNYDFFKEYTSVGIDSKIFERAYELAFGLGFRHINDCIHTAISERYCESLITCNKDDFKKIKKLSSVKITIL